MKILELTGTEYVSRLITGDDMRGYDKIKVSGVVKLPKYIKRIPDTPTEFDLEFNASQGELEYFNHVVRGNAFFGECKNITLGENARFESIVSFNDSGLKRFNNIAGGCYLCGCVLEEVGDKTDVNEMNIENSNASVLRGKMGTLSLINCKVGDVAVAVKNGFKVRACSVENMTVCAQELEITSTKINKPLTGDVKKLLMVNTEVVEIGMLEMAVCSAVECKSLKGFSGPVAYKTLNLQNTSVERIEGVVENCNLKNNKNIKSIGDELKVRNLSVAGIGLEEVNTRATKCTVTSCPTLKRFGPNAKFNTLTCDNKTVGPEVEFEGSAKVCTFIGKIGSMKKGSSFKELHIVGGGITDLDCTVEGDCSIVGAHKLENVNIKAENLCVSGCSNLRWFEGRIMGDCSLANNKNLERVSTNTKVMWELDVTGTKVGRLSCEVGFLRCDDEGRDIYVGDKVRSLIGKANFIKRNLGKEKKPHMEL